MSSSHTVKCPICFKMFSHDFIEIHAQKCKGDEKNNATRDLDMPEAKKLKLAPKQSSTLQKLSSSKLKGNSFKHSLEQFKSQNPSSAKSEFPTFTRGLAKISNSCSMDRGPLAPLAERSRPSVMQDYFGQDQVLGKGCVLNELLRSGMIPSMILWGPPGCGKTSLAHVIATKAKNNPNSSMRFVKLSATNSGKADVQAAVATAKNDRKMFKRKTILFIDEIHRFNKLQQDTFLPHVEDGTIILIGATTENPSFSLNSALLSRCRVIVLEKLSVENVKTIMLRALEKFEKDVQVIGRKGSQETKCCSIEASRNDVNSSDCEIIDNGAGPGRKKVTISDEAIQTLANLCDGDARTALSGLQLAIQASKSVEASGDNGDSHIDVEMIKKNLHRSHILYDRTGDQHFEIISAFQKSIRGSDDNATLYWLARMLEGGEDPKYISRRLIVIASEDIGLADSNALNLAISTQQACQFVGMPECGVILAHCAVYMARAPKSVEVYMAYRKARDQVQYHEGPLPGVPLHLRNASTPLMKKMGYGKGYQHMPEDGSQTYLPDSLLQCSFF